MSKQQASCKDAKARSSEKEKKLIRNSTAEFLIFTGQAGEQGIEARYEEETVWLTQKLMAELFAVTVPTINEHLKNILASGELDADAVIRKFRITAADGQNSNGTQWPMVPNGQWCPMANGAQWPMVPGFQVDKFRPMVPGFQVDKFRTVWKAGLPVATRAPQGFLHHLRATGVAGCGTTIWLRHGRRCPGELCQYLLHCPQEINCRQSFFSSPAAVTEPGGESTGNRSSPVAARPDRASFCAATPPSFFTLQDLP